MTYYKPAAAPAIDSTEARGKDVKKKKNKTKPGHAHIKYPIAHSMNIKSPSVVAMVLLLNISRDNNGYGALEGGQRRCMHPPLVMEKETGTVATLFHMHS